MSCANSTRFIAGSDANDRDPSGKVGMTFNFRHQKPFSTEKGFRLRITGLLLKLGRYTDDSEMPFLSSVRISRAVSFTR